MKTVGLVILLAFLVPGMALAQSSLADVQRSHIDANIPTAANFPKFLKRDLLGYLQIHGFPEATSVSFSLLRDGPTQSGVAYPKFYLWVDVFQGKRLLTQGAARVAAIERTYFQVTDFLPGSVVRASPDQVSSAFPAPLVASIVSRAKASPLLRHPSRGSTSTP